MKAIGFLLAAICLLAGCASAPDGAARMQGVADKVAAQGFETFYVGQGAARIYVAQRVRDLTRPARVYIEGDGFAYLAPGQVSPDPTPRKPVWLDMAAADPAPNVIYMGRPCQYGRDGCTWADWTTRRFSADKLAALNAALDAVRARDGLTRGFELAGYSGGAHFAALMAAMRCDVVGLRTLAGNLDVPAFIAAHKLSALDVPDTPLAHADSLRGVPQRHLVSRDDRVIPPQLVQDYAARLGLNPPDVTVVDGPSHGGDWAAYWADFLAVPLPARPQGGAGCAAPL